MAATLGVATLDYAPYAFFNLVNPLLAGVMAYLGFKILRIAPPRPEIVRTSDRLPADA